jgi:uncharacterized membrane protein (UPF0127 family)
VTFADARLRWLLAVVLLLVAAGLGAYAWIRTDEPSVPRLDPELGLPSAATPAPGNPDRVQLDGFEEVAIWVDPGDDRPLLAWCLLAALNAEQRGRGLMEVTDLQGYSGMAFVYDEDVAGGYYMRNTPTPLSIAWVAADGEVVTITDMAPCEDREGCPTYTPDGPYRYAIETFQGDLDELGITEEATVTVGGRCAPT